MNYNCSKNADVATHSEENPEFEVSGANMGVQDKVITLLHEYASTIIQNISTERNRGYHFWKNYEQEVLGLRSVNWPRENSWWDKDLAFESLYGFQAAYSLLCDAWAHQKRIEVSGRSAEYNERFLSETKAHQFYKPSWRAVSSDSQLYYGKFACIIENTDSPEHGWSSLLSLTYQMALPEVARKDLGEFYTPGDLAQFLSEEMSFPGASIKESKICDPSCGSGIFLEKALRILTKSFSPSLTDLANSVLGFDLNPPAVIAAWATYNMFVSQNYDLEDRTFDVPVYLADTFRLDEKMFGSNGNQRSLFNESSNSESHVDKLVSSEINKIKESGEFNYVIGNPAWINWSDINDKTKSNLKSVLDRYRLAEGRGRSVIGAVRLDSAVVALVKAVDDLLQDGGLLGFFITQAALKAKSMDGFRRFDLPDGNRYRPLRLHDFSSAQLFPGASNRASCLIVRKGEAPTYPVEVFKWRPVHIDVQKGSRSRLTFQSGSSVHLRAERRKAYPLGERNSPWVTLPDSIAKLVEYVTGQPNPYQPRLGVNTGGGSSSFWGFVRRTDGQTEFRNDPHAGRIDSPEMPWTEVEPDLLYPLLKGRGLNRWGIETDQKTIIVPHLPSTGQKPMSEDELRSDYPGAYKYFSNEAMKEHLSSRRAFLRWGGSGNNPWYTLFEIGPYTFAPYKVGYRGQVATKFIAAVFSQVEDDTLGQQMVVPDQTVHFIPCKHKGEAYYLCGVLNSVFVRLLYRCFDYKHPSTFFVKALRIPRFSEDDRACTDISEIAERASQSKTGKNLHSDLDYAVGDLLSLDRKFTKICRRKFYDR